MNVRSVDEVELVMQSSRDTVTRPTLNSGHLVLDMGQAALKDMPSLNFCSAYGSILDHSLKATSGVSPAARQIAKRFRFAFSWIRSRLVVSISRQCVLCPKGLGSAYAESLICHEVCPK